MKHGWNMLLASALAVTFVGSARAQVVIGSSVDLRVEATVGNTTDVKTDGQSQGATLNTLVANAQASAVEGSGSINAYTFIQAGWSNAASGVVVYEGVGWSTDGVGGGSISNGNGNDWTYMFQATGNGLLNVDYTVGAGGSETFGLNGFSVSLVSGSSSDGTFTFLNNGSWSTSVVNGETYTFKIFNGANIGGGLGTRNSNMVGFFNWNITGQRDPGGPSVPEPGSIALLFGSALGAVALRSRSRK